MQVQKYFPYLVAAAAVTAILLPHIALGVIDFSHRQSLDRKQVFEACRTKLRRHELPGSWRVTEFATLRFNRGRTIDFAGVLQGPDAEELESARRSGRLYPATGSDARRYLPLIDRDHFLSGRAAEGEVVVYRFAKHRDGLPHFPALLAIHAPGGTEYYLLERDFEY